MWLLEMWLLCVVAGWCSLQSCGVFSWRNRNGMKTPEYSRFSTAFSLLLVMFYAQTVPFAGV